MAGNATTPFPEVHGEKTKGVALEPIFLNYNNIWKNFIWKGFDIKSVSSTLSCNVEMWLLLYI
jgi:hypothetical protein